MTDWDRSRRWTVHQSFAVAQQLSAVFATRPTAGELSKLQALVPNLGQRPLSEIEALVTSEGRLEVGVFAAEQAQQVVESATAAGLHLEQREVRQPTYLFVDEARGEALVIDDLEEARRVALEMIAAGAPVVRFDDR